MRVVSSRRGRATNGPSITTVAQVADADELVVLKVVTEADSYEPQCKVTVRVLQANGEWGSPVVYRTAERTHQYKSDLMAGRSHLRDAEAHRDALETAMTDDEAEALSEALEILNAGLKSDLV